MLALSIRQPWAACCAAGIKPVENRMKPSAHRGPLLIHASSNMTWSDVLDFAEFIYCHDLDLGILEAVRIFDLPRGGVIGQVEMIDCVPAYHEGEHDDGTPCGRGLTPEQCKWLVGPYGYVFAGAKELPYAPIKGQLGLFDLAETDMAMAIRGAEILRQHRERAAAQVRDLEARNRGKLSSIPEWDNFAGKPAPQKFHRARQTLGELIAQAKTGRFKD